MKYIKSLLFISVVSCAFLSSCEKLAEEETPVCKDCYEIKYRNPDIPKDTLRFNRLCGGDVILWESFPDSVVNADTTIKYFCK